MSKIENLSVAMADQYLTIEEASQVLGIKTSVLRNYLHLDKITTYKFKTLTLVSKREVEQWKIRQEK